MEKNDTYWMWLAGTLAALASLGVFVYTLGENGMPETFWPIVLEDVLLIIFLTGFTVSLDRVRVALGRRPWLRGPGSVLLLTVIPFAVAAGIFAGHASSQADPAVGSASSGYAKQLQKEMRALRRTAAAASLGDAANPKEYARAAEKLSSLYEGTGADLSDLKVGPRDRTAHQRLVNRLAILGAAYGHLAKVVRARSSSGSEIDHARKRVQAAMRGVRAAEQGLERLGYRLALGGSPPTKR